jgi:TRAP-type transport system periplasmic protein
VKTLVSLVLSLLVVASAHAEPQPLVFRIGTLMPDGSSWAREMLALMRNLETATNGRVRLKVYWGGAAGDESEELERVRRGQLDGMIGAMGCEQVAPSMRLVRLPGLFQNRDEAATIMNALLPEFEAEAAAAGFVIPVTAGMGPDVYFTARPIHSMSELRKLKLWRWGIDVVGTETSRAMGMNIVTTTVTEAAHALATRQVEGVIAIPLAALAWQWSARARYVTDLRGSYLWGCFVMSALRFNRMLPEDRTAFRAAAAQMSSRIEAIGRVQDEELLSGKYKAQGPIPVRVSSAFRTEYFASALDAREKLGKRFVSSELLNRVLRMLADYRAEHPSGSP